MCFGPGSLLCQEVFTLELALTLLKRGLVLFPRLVLDFYVDLDLGYELIGKLLVFLNEPELQEQQEALPGAEYRLRVPDPVRYRYLKERLQEFEDSDLVRNEELPGTTDLIFSFAPLYRRLSSLLHAHRMVAEVAAGAAAVPAALPEAPAPGAPEPAPAGRGFLDQVEAHKPLLRYVEGRLVRQLSEREVADIFDWLNTYGFDDRVARAVIDEGIQAGVTHFKYLNQIARRWHEKGIRSVDDVEQDRQERQRRTALWGKVAQRLSISRTITPAEQAMAEKWHQDWNFAEEVILRACDETVYTREPTFAYVDRVLAGWRSRGVQTLEEAERALAEYKRSRPAGQGRGQPAPGRGQPGKSNVFWSPKTKEDIDYEKYVKRPGR